MRLYSEQHLHSFAHGFFFASKAPRAHDGRELFRGLHTGFSGLGMSHAPSPQNKASIEFVDMLILSRQLETSQHIDDGVISRCHIVFKDCQIREPSSVKKRADWLTNSTSWVVPGTASTIARALAGCSGSLARPAGRWTVALRPARYLVAPGPPG